MSYIHFGTATVSPVGMSETFFDAFSFIWRQIRTTKYFISKKQDNLIYFDLPQTAFYIQKTHIFLQEEKTFNFFKLGYNKIYKLSLKILRVASNK